MSELPCPCDLGLPYARCCGPRHDGSRPAETAVALMRSRYSAYATGKFDYLHATHAQGATDEEKKAMVAGSLRAKWLSLEIQSTEGGGEAEREGFVTFKARYVVGTKIHALVERSRFDRPEARWRYVEGAATWSVEPHAPGRNDPCPCASGKKFKQCHAT